MRRGGSSLLSVRLRNVEVYDVAAGRFTDGEVEIADGLLVAPDSTSVGHEIDLGGAYLLPGFIDCHVHIAVDTSAADPNNLWHNALPGTIALSAAHNARRLLECGITTARDVGGWDYHEIAVREAIDAGMIPGPRLLCSGRILSITSPTTPYYDGMYEEADGAAEVRKAARRQFAHGADHLKLLATGAITSSRYERADAVQYRRDEIEEAVRIADDNHAYVAAHAHADAGIRNAVEAGVRSIEHGTYASDETLGSMIEHGTFLVPTTRTTPAMMNDPFVVAAVPDHIRRRYEQAHQRQIDTFKRAHQRGVRIAMGTDAGTPGNHFGDNMQELEVMVDEGGMSPSEAIRSATAVAAELLGLSDEVGSIEPGKRADLIAVRSDPLQDISALRDVSFVMKDGVVHRHDR